MSETLGFSVACYQGDIPLLRGCLASIRHFAPDAPICLIADGDFSTRAFEKAYGAVTIRRTDLKNKDLRKWSFGYGLTKMVALWEAPFDRVFHIDADAVMWGDVRKNLPQGDWDMIYNEPHEEITPHILRSQYFDPAIAFEHIPWFHWERRPFFNGGAFCIKRGVLDVDKYINMLEIQRKYPRVFDPGEQGILGVLTFSAVDANEIKATQAHLQSVVPNLDSRELSQRFRLDSDGPIPWSQPTIIHWAGPKPYGSRPDTFPEPMDYFRLRGMRQVGWPKWLINDHGLRWDEWRCRTWPKHVLRAKKTVKRLIGSGA